MKQELKDIEDQILYRLSASEGNPVDNVELIEVLEQSKVKAGEIKVLAFCSNKLSIATYETPFDSTIYTYWKFCLLVYIVTYLLTCFRTTILYSNINASKI